MMSPELSALTDPTDLADMPVFLSQLTAELSMERLTRKPSALEFSIQENIWHLRDIEIEGYAVRIEKILNEEMPVLNDIDGGALAKIRKYNELDFQTGLSEFIEARTKNLAIIRDLTPDKLELWGLFDGDEKVSLNGILRMMREHDAEHRAELEALSDG